MPCRRAPRGVVVVAALSNAGPLLPAVALVKALLRLRTLLPRPLLGKLLMLRMSPGIVALFPTDLREPGGSRARRARPYGRALPGASPIPGPRPWRLCLLLARLHPLPLRRVLRLAQRGRCRSQLVLPWPALSRDLGMEARI